MTWTTDSSETYRQLAAIAVPLRTEQIAALLTLIPFAQQDTFRVVELASGEGRLSQAILHAFPNATLLALDYEESMRQETSKRLAPFGERARVAAFDMQQSDWYGLLDGVDVVVSSLCIHHLDGEGKQGLFQAVADRLSAQGAFLIADLVLPKRAQSRTLFQATWDSTAKSAADAYEGDLFSLFESEEWNYYRYPDDFDKPSPLADQLVWLNEAGLTDVDCFWMIAGHAIYGGYGANAGDKGIPYATAYIAAREALS